MLGLYLFSTNQSKLGSHRFAEDAASQFPIFALGQNAEKRPTMPSASSECLPCFTKSGTRRLWNSKLCRLEFVAVSRSYPPEYKALIICGG